VIASRGRPGTDYVLIARSTTGGRAYVELLADLETALHQVERGPRESRAPAPRR
jgi:RNase P protein component